jgi:hypothetical protein
MPVPKSSQARSAIDPDAVQQPPSLAELLLESRFFSPELAAAVHSCGAALEAAFVRDRRLLESQLDRMIQMEIRKVSHSRMCADSELSLDLHSHDGLRL